MERNEAQDTHTQPKMRANATNQQGPKYECPQAPTECGSGVGSIPQEDNRGPREGDIFHQKTEEFPNGEAFCLSSCEYNVETPRGLQHMSGITKEMQHGNTNGGKNTEKLGGRTAQKEVHAGKFRKAKKCGNEIAKTCCMDRVTETLKMKKGEVRAREEHRDCRHDAVKLTKADDVKKRWWKQVKVRRSCLDRCWQREVGGNRRWRKSVGVERTS